MKPHWLSIVVLAAACDRDHHAAQLAAPSASASAAPVTALFPEDPSLDATAIANTSFVQETWTGANDSQQHCHEWGFDPSRSHAVLESTNALLASRDIHLPDKGRAKNLVVAIGPFEPGAVDHGSLAKLIVCTEGVAPRSAHEAFTARLMADRNAPRSAAFANLGLPDAAWERKHTTGEVEFGFRYPHVEAVKSKPVLDAMEADHDPRFKAHLRGTDLWWTALRSM